MSLHTAKQRLRSSRVLGSDGDQVLAQSLTEALDRIAVLERNVTALDCVLEEVLHKLEVECGQLKKEARTLNALVQALSQKGRKA